MRRLLSFFGRCPVPGQKVGAKIRAIRPNRSAALGAHLREKRGVASDLFEDRTNQEPGHIPLDNGTIRKSQPQSEELEGFDFANPQQSHRFDLSRAV
jgi:hypothetical protein